ncbi:MAG: zinc-dependent metalloprotease [Pirellulales bacterium]|nr:zinc-dependent metalloprotease [Pirellulales bacterium]
MRACRTLFGPILFGCLALTVGLSHAADSPANDTPSASAEAPAANARAADTVATAAPAFPPFNEVIKEPKTTEGLIKIHQEKGRLFAELAPGDLNRDFIVLIAIAKGIGEGPLLGGMTWGFGDDWVWQFRKVDDNIQVVRRNVRFKANPGSPEADAVALAYTDSVLFALPIATMSPSGAYVVDLSQVFLSDLPQIASILPGFGFASNRSTVSKVKGFPNNLELEIAATYASGGMIELDSVPDSRGVTINIHYSISALPQTNYKPRLADDRVGYFLTVTKDYSKQGDLDRFVRYINRWQLEKADASAELSPPKKPIIFYLEKTVPYAYRKPIREGIEEWNKAFEKAGYVNAIEVRQQSDRDEWDPEDINFNTFRWITASAGFAMGPSRVNPLTGQILDADIIFDADFVESWKQEYETFTPASIAALTGGALDVKSYEEELRRMPQFLRHAHGCRCELHGGLTRELAFGSAALTIAAEASPATDGQVEKMILQGLKEVTMHEVGHTLGLRHNFKASSWLTLAEANDPTKTSQHGLTASVMDYNPTNIAPKGTPQGDYFSTTLGPYDLWAIEYGYKNVSGGSPEGELAELKKIASRCGEPGLAFATDEDTRGIDSDPYSNRFDLGADPIEYASQRAKIIADLWPGLVDRVSAEGDGYQKVRRAFGILLGNHGRAMFFASRFVGGVSVNRDHKGDANAKAPFVIVPADKQRAALALLEEQVFSAKPFQFPPELYNHLAASRWVHWGTFDPPRVDYPAHEVILMWQTRILDQLLSSLTLQRLYDSELKVDADQDAMSTAELIERLTTAVYAELGKIDAAGQYTNRKPAVSSLRRNLQRYYLSMLSSLAMGNSGAPADCATVAYITLEDLKARIDAQLAADVKLDTYTRAHLRESSTRIAKVLDARLELGQP